MRKIAIAMSALGLISCSTTNVDTYERNAQAPLVEEMVTPTMVNICLAAVANKYSPTVMLGDVGQDLSEVLEQDITAFEDDDLYTDVNDSDVFFDGEDDINGYDASTSPTNLSTLNSAQRSMQIMELMRKRMKVRTILRQYQPIKKQSQIQGRTWTLPLSNGFLEIVTGGQKPYWCTVRTYGGDAQQQMEIMKLFLSQDVYDQEFATLGRHGGLDVWQSTVQMNESETIKMRFFVGDHTDVSEPNFGVSLWPSDLEEKAID